MAETFYVSNLLFSVLLEMNIIIQFQIVSVSIFLKTIYDSGDRNFQFIKRVFKIYVSSESK